MANGQLEIVLRHIHRLATEHHDAELTDGQLLEQFAQGERESAFTALVRRHGPMVLGVCRRVLHDRHAAEDAFQATFLVLFRKASSLDRRGSVASWLYTVAYHAALRAKADTARRLRQERQVREMPQLELHSEEVWRDLRPVLDEELSRLPEKYRAAVLLCYVEGKTNEEAARLLSVPAGTIKSRLSRARELLRTRLSRRGITLSAGLVGAILAEHATAAVPAGLVHTTVNTALLSAAGLASAPAAALAEGVLQAMFATKLKIATAFVIAVSVAALSIGTIAHRAVAERQAAGGAQAAASDRERPAKQAPKEAEKEKKSAPATAGKPGKAEDKQTVTLTGRVLDAGGKAVGDANVAVLGMGLQPVRTPHQGPWAPRILGETKADNEGRFRLQLPPTAGSDLWGAFVLAGKTGHALGCRRLDIEARQPEVELRLPAEQILRGRLVDLQGQAAAGVQVHVFGLREYRSEERIYVLAYMSSALRLLPKPLAWWPKPATTDAQGRFSLHGLGRDWHVTIKVEHDRFAPQELDIKPEDARKGEITRALAPARWLEGDVTHADTGKAVPNARIVVWTRPGEVELNPNYWAEGRADAHGRFRISLPLGHFIEVVAYPPAGTPYLPLRRGLNWPRADALKQKVTLALPRGILVRGLVKEAPSGKPLAGAWVGFEQFQDGNPYYRDDVRVFNVHQPVNHFSGPDGKFEIVILPGPGHLLINGPTLDYLHDEITTKKLNGSGFGPNRRNYYDAIVPLNLKPQTGAYELTATVRRGVTLTGHLVGPDGKPVKRAEMLCRSYLPYGYDFNGKSGKEIKDGYFELPGCDPEKTVEVFFVDPQNQLGARVELSARQSDGKPVTVRLQPCGKAKARLVSGDGKPLPNIWPVTQLVLTPGKPIELDGKDPLADVVFLANVDTEHHNGPNFRTDAQGRATFLTLIPDAKHWIEGSSPKGRFHKEFTVKAGELLDLGDIVAKTPPE